MKKVKAKKHPSFGDASSKLLGLFKKGKQNIGAQFGDALISGRAFKKKPKSKRVKAK